MTEHDGLSAGRMGRANLWAACEAHASPAWGNRRQAHSPTLCHVIHASLEAKGRAVMGPHEPTRRRPLSQDASLVLAVYMPGPFSQRTLTVVHAKFCCKPCAPGLGHIELPWSSGVEQTHWSSCCNFSPCIVDFSSCSMHCTRPARCIAFHLSLKPRPCGMYTYLPSCSMH